MCSAVCYAEMAPAAVLRLLQQTAQQAWSCSQVKHMVTVADWEYLT